MMKKFSLLVVLLVVALGALTLPTAAQAEVTTLARYFPADAPVFAAFRTDDAFIETLDALSAKIGSFIPGGVTPGSLPELLDQAAVAVEPGGTFAETIRPWLGDSAAVGMFNLEGQSTSDSQPPFTLALAITDQDKAQQFFDLVPNTEVYDFSVGEDFTLYSPPDAAPEAPYVIFRSDVVLITTDEALVEGGGLLDATLDQNEAFTSAIGLLPADQYSAVAYIDTSAIVAEAMDSADREAMGAFGGLLGAVKPQAFGLTILNDRSITLDAVSPIDASAAEGLALTTGTGVIDSTFAGHIPSGTPFVVLGSDLYHSYQGAFENLRTLANSEMGAGSTMPEDVEQAIAALEFGVRGLTGLEVDEAFGWMTGDFALYLGFTPAFADAQNLFSAMTRLPVDLGLTIEATDSEQAQALYDGLVTSLSAMPAENFTVAEETLESGIEALVLTATSPDVPFPVELLVATGNGVFTMGTRRMVTAALNPQNGLDGDPFFTEAVATLLQNPYSVLYVAGNGFQPLARLMMAETSTQEDGAELQAVLDLINSVTFSTSMLPDNGGSLSRFVWTLPE
jgi:hypothetical protein